MSTDSTAAHEDRIAQLVAGADDSRVVEGAERTPGQFIHWLLGLGAAQRLEVAARINQNAAEASACFMQDHLGRLAWLEEQVRVGLWLVAEARWVAAWGGVNQDSGIGDATVVRHDDGRRTVEHAAPIIRVAADVLAQLTPEADVIEPDGTLRLDTAGEYRYRYLRSESPHTLLYERIDSA